MRDATHMKDSKVASYSLCAGRLEGAAREVLIIMGVIVGLVSTSLQAMGDVADQGLRTGALLCWRFVRNDGSTMGMLTDGYWRLKAQWKYSLVALGHGASWYTADANSYCWQEGERKLDLSNPIYKAVFGNMAMNNCGVFHSAIHRHLSSVVSVQNRRK